MVAGNGAYRWWENYLVRYLMPSIAGAAIVNWLACIAGQDFKQILLIDVGSSGLQTPTLVLLFLYGNLFCYVSSYPILGFHVTRVIDFEKGKWRKRVWDGYISTLLLACVVLLVSIISGVTPFLNRVVPFAAVLIFTSIQLYRIYITFENVRFENLSGQVPKIFAFAHTISKRRGVAEELRITKQSTKDQEDEDTGDKFDEEMEWQKRSIWRREFIDTYRHMREHGNSAFIFVLELTLAGLCFLLLTAYKDETAATLLSLIGVLFALWSIPAMFIHFIGQHIERRFSWYDRNVKPISKASKEGT